MNSKEQMKKLMSDNKVSMSGLGRRLGLSRQCIYERLSSDGDLSCEVMVEMLNGMDYRLCYVPAKDTKLHSDWYEIKKPV